MSGDNVTKEVLGQKLLPANEQQHKNPLEVRGRAIRLLP